MSVAEAIASTSVAYHRGVDTARLADFRAVFADAVTARAGCLDPRIRDAFARVPRHAFVPPGPWRFSEHGTATASADPALLYQDLALGLGNGLTTGTPSLHATLLDAVAIRAGETIVQIGTGMGYFSAILAELTGAAGHVRAFEIDPIAEVAREKLAPWPNVRVEARSGIATHEPADVLYAFAGVQQIPREWIDALRPGGRMLVPIVPGDREGGMLLATRRNRGFDARFVCPARFIPCIGATDEHAATRLSEAFARGDMSSVRSLRIDSQPDASAWFAGKGWWLSRDQVSAS